MAKFLLQISKSNITESINWCLLFCLSGGVKGQNLSAIKQETQNTKKNIRSGKVASIYKGIAGWATEPCIVSSWQRKILQFVFLGNLENYSVQANESRHFITLYHFFANFFSLSPFFPLSLFLPQNEKLILL